MALQGKAAAIDHQLAALVDRGLDPAFDIGLVHCGDDRAVLRLGIARHADLERMDRRDQLGPQTLSGVFADRHHHRQRHAALAGRAERRAAQVIDHHVEVGVGHDHAVVLGSAHRLHALARGHPARIDVLGDVGRADKADCADRRVIEDQVDHFLVAVNDLEDPVGQACFEPQLSDPARHRGVAFGGLEDKGVARRNRHRAHPQRDHRGEVEGGDPRANPDRLTHRIDVDPGAGALRVFTLEDVGQSAAELDHFKSALDVPFAVGDDLAVLGREQRGELVHVALDQRLEIEHHAGPALWVHRGPSGLRGRCGGNRPIERIGAAQHNLGLLAAIVGIHHRALAGADQPARAAVDEMIDHAHGCGLSRFKCSINRRIPSPPIGHCSPACCCLN